MNKAFIPLLLLSALSLLFISSCGSAPPRKPEAELRASSASEAGVRAYQNQNYEKAEDLFRRSLRIYHSIENPEGISESTISLAQVLRASSRKAEARELLEDMEEERALPLTEEQRARASLLLGLMAMEEDDIEVARRKALNAEELCGDCPLEGKILNLKARIELGSGRASAARELSARALELNEASGNRTETANSLRIMAEAETVDGRLNEGRELFLRSLALDKELALDSKIGADLIGLGALELKAGRCTEAGAYLRRALSVGRNSTHPFLEAQSRLMLEKHEKECGGATLP